ncbi:hypothetical protein VTG60DRAFT_4485 [Thermothelomyces hinnuleus]
MPGSITILRGFKVSTAVLDAFLAANGVDETYGAPPFYYNHPDKCPISRLLYAKIAAKDPEADRNRFRVNIPSLESYNDSVVAYVSYTWVTVFSHRELNMDEDLPAEVPLGFEELRQEVLSFCASVPEPQKIPDEGRMGLYVVRTHDIRGLYIPQEILDRSKLPQYCGRCDAVFYDDPYPYRAFYKRQLHRKDVHGCPEGTNPLPNA